MSLVLITSSGVVRAAAMPPDTLPHSAASYDLVGRSNQLAKQLWGHSQHKNKYMSIF